MVSERKKLLIKQKKKKFHLDLHISIANFNAKVCEATPTQSFRKEGINQVIYPAKRLYKHKAQCRT